MKNKPDYWYKQSSVIPFRNNNGSIELLIISSRKNKRWIFPKGIIEENISSRESALKEALEEAGIEGEVLKDLVGKYKYKKWGGKCKVNVYGMKVTVLYDTWEENFRERKWVRLEEVNEYITHKKILKIIQTLAERQKN